MLGGLGPLLVNPYVLAAVAVGGLAWWLLSGDESEETKWRKSKRKPTIKKPPLRPMTKGMPEFGANIDTKGIPEYATGIFEIGKTGPGMVSRGDTILDNKAAKDFKDGMGVYKNLMGHAEGIGSAKGDYPAQLHKGEVQIKGGMNKLLEGTDFKNMEEFSYNAKESVGYSALMDQFLTSGMLESKYGERLKNVAMLFGLAGHGQMGTREFLGSTIDQFSMGPKTVERLFERLNYFKEGVSRQKKRSNETGSRWTKGRERNLNELNAMQAIQEISKSMALWGDSPEEQAAIKRYRDLEAQGKWYEAAGLTYEEGEAMGTRFAAEQNQKWDNFAKSGLVKGKNFTNFAKGVTDKDKKFGLAVPQGKYGMGVAKGGLGLLHKGEEVLEKAEVATIAQALAGNQLNNAAYNRVGLREQGGGGFAPTVINAPTTVNNDTIMPPRITSPHARDAFGERRDFISKIA
jgi:hypothetical protein